MSTSTPAALSRTRRIALLLAALGLLVPAGGTLAGCAGEDGGGVVNEEGNGGEDGEGEDGEGEGGEGDY